MKMLLLLGLIINFSVLAQTPSLSPEQTVRQWYHSYSGEFNPSTPWFGDTGEKAIISARVKNALILNNQLTLPGDIGVLDYDPLCACQDYDHLVLESVTIKPVNEMYVDATVRFRVFADSKERVTQTLKLVAENDRWVIDDISADYGSVYQNINNENQAMLSKLTSLQKAQPEDFIHALFKNLSDYSWPWTWVVSTQYRQAVDEYHQATFRSHEDWAAQKGILSRTASLPWPWTWPFSIDYRQAVNSDNQIAFIRPGQLMEAMNVDMSYLYNNPICDCNVADFNAAEEIRVIEKNDNRARIFVRFSIKGTPTVEHKEQEFILRRVDNQWEIEDFIRPDSGSLLKQMQAITRQRIQAKSL